MVERIKELCKEKGTNLSRLEAELGFANGTIKRWDRNIPASDRLLLVASYFDVTVEYLMTGEQKPPVNSDERSAGVINWVETFQDKDELIKLLSAYQNIAPEKRPVYLEILQRGGEHKE